MNVLDPNLYPTIARTDRDGRLTDADPRLLDLVERAGGAIGEALPIAPVAALVRLACRLGIAIARSVTVADGDDDIELHVRAEPEVGGVQLIVGGWHPRPTWREPTDGSRREADFARTEAGWAWETDAALILTHVALEAGPRLGFDAPAALGRPLDRLFAMVADADGRLPILGAVASVSAFSGQRAGLLGTDHRLRLSATPRVDDRGRFAGFIGTALEVEEGDDATPAILSGRLDRSLRRPLERIIANAGSMSAALDGPIAPSYAGYADDIANAGRHLLGLVDDLVDLEAIERDDFVVEQEPIDLADVARRAAGLLAVRASEGNVRIDRPAAEEALMAIGDFRRALQILVNLIGNAVRYSPPGSMVWVRVEREDGQARVTVADQGKGIAATDQARIFEKFGRVDPNEAGGSGLGLYISRRLARAMGGDVTVDSAPGQGARFIFTLSFG